MSQKLQITNQVWWLSDCDRSTLNWYQQRTEKKEYSERKNIIFLIESLHQSVKCMIDAVKSLELG